MQNWTSSIDSRVVNWKWMRLPFDWPIVLVWAVYMYILYAIFRILPFFCVLHGVPVKLLCRIGFVYDSRWWCIYCYLIEIIFCCYVNKSNIYCIWWMVDGRMRGIKYRESGKLYAYSINICMRIMMMSNDKRIQVLQLQATISLCCTICCIRNQLLL